LGVLELDDPDGTKVASHQFDRGSAQGVALQVNAIKPGFHSFFVQAANTPAQNKTPSYKLSVRYTAPRTLQHV
jgi:LAS superfamily LD-carboxypeptidase LdcB